MQTDNRTFDMMLGRYCGPALAGIKPANMICIKKEKLPLFKTLLVEYNQSMNKHDIYFSVINETDTSYLMLVYRKSKLAQHLKGYEVEGHLCKADYPVDSDVDTLIGHLRGKFQDQGGLPEEIGLFLGYPIEDIIGFKENKGKNCLMSKYWKVYSDVSSAEKLFNRYDKCKNALCERILKGCTITNMFVKIAA